MLKIEPADGRTRFRPGDAVEGTVLWRFEREPRKVELRLFWYTRGNGMQDADVVESLLFEVPRVEERRMFRFTVPVGPYSFSGKLISLVWALELIAVSPDETERLDITVSPTGQEILLQKTEGGEAQK